MLTSSKGNGILGRGLSKGKEVKGSGVRNLLLSYFRVNLAWYKEVGFYCDHLFEGPSSINHALIDLLALAHSLIKLVFCSRCVRIQ